MNIEKADLLKQKSFTALDRQFADFITKLSGNESPEVMLAALIVSNRTGKGDICVDIPDIAGKNISDVLEDIEFEITLPGEEKWLSMLRKNIVVGAPHEYKPLILDDRGRLFLYRYWNYEQLLVKNIKNRLSGNPDDADLTILRESLTRLFPRSNDDEIDWQQISALAAVFRRFCVISGGPGAGKTSTVIKILALLLEQARNRGYIPEIALAAPTGKAAARLKESIKQARDYLNCCDTIKQNIPEETFTIHRLLRTIPGSPYFHYNAENQLPYDMVIVDESSMADLALMTKLFQAVPLKSRLILLGDKDQLASVEAGAALGDICDTGKKHGYSEDFTAKLKSIIGPMIPAVNPEAEAPPITDSLVTLRKTYRFGSDSGIGELSRAVRNGDVENTIKLLRNKKLDDIRLIDKTKAHSIPAALSDYIINKCHKYLNADSPGESLRLFSEFAILCATRNGPFGIREINKIIETILKNHGLINPLSRWYRGRPVMITRNDYGLRLFNGDVGIILPDMASDNSPRFFSSAPDGSIRKIIPLKLPEHETVYAMTAHKSQGSEFDHVLVLLPDKPGKALVRELLYTAITRARKKVEIWGSEKILRYLINNPTTRKSGLREALWGKR